MSLPIRGIEIIASDYDGLGLFSAKIIVKNQFYRIESRADRGIVIEKLPFIESRNPHEPLIGERVCEGDAIGILAILPAEHKWTVREFFAALAGFNQGRERAQAEERRINKAELTDDWKQQAPSSPLGFLVKVFHEKPNPEDEYGLFVDIEAAKLFADPEDWKIYPLYAGHPREIDNLGEWEKNKRE